MPMPRTGEEKKAYFNRAIPFLIKEEGYPQKQAVAIAYSYWKKKHPHGGGESVSEDIGGDTGATGTQGLRTHKTHVQLSQKKEQFTRKDNVFYQDGKPIGVYLKDGRALVVTEEFLKKNPKAEAALSAKLENVGGAGLSGGIAMYAAPAKVMLKKYYPEETRGLKECLRKIR